VKCNKPKTHVLTAFKNHCTAKQHSSVSLYKSFHHLATKTASQTRRHSNDEQALHVNQRYIGIAGWGSECCSACIAIYKPQCILL